MAWAAYLLPTESGHHLVPGDPLLLDPALMVAPLALSGSVASVLASQASTDFSGFFSSVRYSQHRGWGDVHWLSLRTAHTKTG